MFATFTKQEMQQRVDKLRAFMAEQKIEACVFTSYHNVNYYSGFLYCAFGRPYGLVVTDEDFTVIGASEYNIQSMGGSRPSPNSHSNSHYNLAI